MVERTGGGGGSVGDKDEASRGDAVGRIRQRIKSLNATHCSIIMRLLPKFGESFPRYNLGYLMAIIKVNSEYLLELLDFLLDKDIIMFDGEEYFLTQECVWKIEEVISIQPSVVLLRRIQELAGGGDG